MPALIGLLVGALLGHFVWSGEWGTAIGGLAGFFVGAFVAGHRERAAYRKPRESRDDATRPVAAAGIEQRLGALERRVAQLEAAARSPREAADSLAAPAKLAPSAREAATTPAGLAEAAEPPSMQARAALEAAVGTRPPSPPATDVREAAPALQAATPTHAPSPPEGAAAPAPLHALWRWFTGGNAMTRIGVVVLFFGVAFLLRYFAEHFTVPITLRLLAVAAAGVALVVLGWRLAGSRPAYGWSLQGAGMGVLYLTGFAAFRQFQLLAPGTAFTLLAALSGLTVGLALMAEAEALAALALVGAFVAPLLTEHDRVPGPLFAYFAIVNVVVVLIALRRTWRVVSTLGFLFTFVLGLHWGNSYYRPEHFAAVEPFLALFFAMYVLVAILHARTPAPPAAQPLDALVVFGVPLVAFALQAALLGDTRHGAAWSALAMAALYAAIALVLRTRAVPGWALLARLYVGLAVVLASIAVPYAFDNRVTAALWSIEGALVFWLGVEQRNAWLRGFACLLQLAAGVMFILQGVSGDDALFLNAFFMGAMMLAIAGLASAWLAERNAALLREYERDLVPAVLAWGVFWWIGGGTAELMRQLPRADEAHAVLAWITAAAAIGIALRRALHWRGIAATAAVLPLAMTAAAFSDLSRWHTTLLQWGAVVWPLAWAVYLLALRSDEPTSAADPGTATSSDALRRAGHLVAALGLTAQVAWEASEWVGRITTDDSVWMACAAAAPAIAYLAAATRLRNVASWPFERYGDVYAARAAVPIAVLLAAWIIGVNVLSPGEPYPLPYVALLNPLDIALALALLVSLRWSERVAILDERTRFTLLGIGIFVSLNGAILRVFHHWADIPWDLVALLHSRPLQATVTLAWTVTGAALMFAAAKRSLRPLWMVGAALLAAVVVKLFLLDLSALSGLPRVVAFLGVGSLMLLIGYVSPLPPAGGAAGQRS